MISNNPQIYMGKFTSVQKKKTFQKKKLPTQKMHKKVNKSFALSQI